MTLSWMPRDAWYDIDWVTHQADELLQQGTQKQLLHALALERQQPKKRWTVSSHILLKADIGQITGPVIEQLEWGLGMSLWTDKQTIFGRFNGQAARYEHTTAHIRREMLGGNDSSWTVFLGIITEGTRIGDAVELVTAIEQTDQKT